jgi:iron complex outermembrane receptor protein
VDARYGWRVNRNLEVALIGRNLFDPSHAERADPTPTAEATRNVALTLTWRQ